MRHLHTERPAGIGIKLYLINITKYRHSLLLMHSRQQTIEQRSTRLCICATDNPESHATIQPFPFPFPFDNCVGFFNNCQSIHIIAFDAGGECLNASWSSTSAGALPLTAVHTSTTCIARVHGVGWLIHRRYRRPRDRKLLNSWPTFSPISTIESGVS